MRVLTITHDGTRVVEQAITCVGRITELLGAHRPPAARGSVAQLIDTDLPARHPRRVTTIALSGHHRCGPVWHPAAPQFGSIIPDPITTGGTRP